MMRDEDPSSHASRITPEASHDRPPSGQGRALHARRLGTPEEIASLVLFLAWDEASLVNGACLTADGGLSAWTGHPPVAPDLLDKVR